VCLGRLPPEKLQESAKGQQERGMKGTQKKFFLFSFCSLFSLKKKSVLKHDFLRDTTEGEKKKMVGVATMVSFRRNDMWARHGSLWLSIDSRVSKKPGDDEYESGHAATHTGI
jgi:hypothetical protein